MRRTDWSGICVLAWSLASISAYAAALVWCFLHVDCRAFAGSGMIPDPTKLAQCCCRLASLIWPRSEMDPIEAAANRLFLERRRDFLRRGLFVGAPVIAIGDLFVIARVIQFYDVEDTGEHLSTTHLIVSAMAPALAALCACSKKQPANWALLLAHVVGYSSLSWTLYSCRSGIEMLFDLRTGLVIRFILAMSLCDSRLNILCNASYFVLVLYKLQSFVSKDNEMAQLGLPWYVYQELAACVILVVVPSMLEWRMRTEARATIEAKASTNFIEMQSTLLKINYDVVVDLSHELTFTDDCTHLAGMLLHGPQRSLRGSLITDLMDNDADKDAFSAHVMQPPHTSPSQCCAIPHIFSLRDSCSNIVSVEMWHTRWEDLDSRARHLIGIKERVSDEQPHRRRAVPAPDFDTQISDGAAQMSSAMPARSTGNRSREGTPHVSDHEQPREGHILERDPQQHAPQRRARPQEQADPTPNSEDSDASSVSSTPSVRRATSYMLEGFRRTSGHAQKTSMLKALATWNIAIRPAGCCTYHELMREASHTVKSLARSDCYRFEDIHASRQIWQCPGCKILAPSQTAAKYDFATGSCLMCRAGSAPAARQPAASVIGRIAL